MQANAQETIKPLNWLIGKWKSSEATGMYPTIKSFTYKEELEFKWIGQPMLNYTSCTQHPENKNPMHLESGYLRIKPGTNKVAFMIAHNFGICSIEEGVVDEEACSLEVKSTSISRMEFHKEPAVTEILRSYKLAMDTCQLELVVAMATASTPLTEHLRATYVKC